MVEGSLFLLIVLVALASVTANSLLRAGAQRIALTSLNPEYLLRNIFRIIFNPYILAGGVVFVAGMFIWLRILAQEPLGKSYPAFVGFTIIFVILSSYFFLKEPITLVTVLGMALIVAGTFLAFVS